MRLQKGVSLEGVNHHLLYAAKIIQLIYYEEGNRLECSATKWSRDSFRESHEAGYAIDVLKPERNIFDVVPKIKHALGDNFIIRILGDHLHIEYDPRLIRNTEGV